MKNNNTKYWSFPWETNLKQKKLPSDQKLGNFLTAEASEAIFQLKMGGKKQKEHFQGVFPFLNIHCDFWTSSFTEACAVSEAMIETIRMRMESGRFFFSLLEFSKLWH